MDHDAHEPHGDDRDLSDAIESDATVIGSASSITPQVFPSGLTSRELAHALRGEMLGHFLLQQYIGGGGMGVVFKALDTTLDRIVAVKVVASRQVGDEDLQRRFLIEAQSTARLDHPNIARIHYIGRDRGLPYIVFEFIDGENIRDLVVESGRMPTAEAISYVYQIAHALAHAWQREVVHRDIKPSNILVTTDGQAKLVDMGLARLRQMNDETEHELTATGITLGTFDYISPEQARDPRLADARSDIYSLGCTLFYMLAGQPPFAQGTALQKLLQHQSDRPPDIRSFRSDIPDSVSRVVRQMLAKAPGDRQQTPVELIAELAEILEELGAPLPFAATTLPWTMPPRTIPRWRKHALWAMPVATLLLFGFAFDRLTRVGGALASFTELRTPAKSIFDPSTAIAAPTSAPHAPAVDAPPPVAVSTEVAAAAAPLDSRSTTASSDLRPHFFLDEPWKIDSPPWGSLSQWPAEAEPPLAPINKPPALLADPLALPLSMPESTSITLPAPTADSSATP